MQQSTKETWSAAFGGFGVALFLVGLFLLFSTNDIVVSHCKMAIGLALAAFGGGLRYFSLTKAVILGFALPFVAYGILYFVAFFLILAGLIHTNL